MQHASLTSRYVFDFIDHCDSFLTLPKDRYQEFLRILRMWRHLRLLKRGGRAHDPTGVQGTGPGELAVLCPACPYPNINLPADWKSVAKDAEYVLNFVLLS